MIAITLPDGTVKEVSEGTTSLDVATSISEGLARNVLAAEVNGEVWDPTRPFTGDSTLKLLTSRDDEGMSTLWHSSAHL
ncbi:MAG: TGS domain-containing protein, partial [Flavobacteriales bacterium]